MTIQEIKNDKMYELNTEINENLKKLNKNLITCNEIPNDEVDHKNNTRISGIKLPSVYK